MFIFCGGMPRSGSTLQYQITASIIERLELGQRLPWMPPGELDSKLPGIGCDHFNVVKSHAPTPKIIQMVKDGDAQALYIHRDLRDVVVSTMWHHNIRFEDVWASTTLSDAVSWGATWESLPGVLVQSYSHATGDNLLLGIDQICKHLNLDVSESIKVEIANGHTINNQQRRIANIPKDRVWHERELLRRNHIGGMNGVDGQWRTVLTREQVKQIEIKYGYWLAQNGYNIGR
jgi:hypothetical protein